MGASSSKSSSGSNSGNNGNNGSNNPNNANARRKVVVIVGAGQAGLTLARKLDASNLYDVIVIERRNYFFHSIGALRAAVQPSFVSQIAVPYHKALRNGIIVQGEVTRIDPESRLIDMFGREEPIRYDFAVVCTGSSYAFPRRIHSPHLHDVQAAYDAFHARLRAATNVLIVGGGAVGVELAGEIATELPDKSVTIVQRGAHLVSDRLLTQHHVSIHDQLTRLRVNVMLNDAVPITDEMREEAGDLLYVSGARRVSTAKGVVLDTDLIIFANGPQINSTVYTGESPLAGSVKDDRLIVDQYFLVKDSQNVFAIGDCALIEARQAMFAVQQAEMLGSNMIAAARNRNVQPYEVSTKPAIFLSIGRNGGSGEKDGSLLPSWLVRFFKSSDLLVGRAHKLLRLSPSRRSAAPAAVPPAAVAFTAKQKKRAQMCLNTSSQSVNALVEGSPALPVERGQMHL